MRAAVYDPAAPQGARLVERAAPKPAKRCCRGVVLCEVRSCGANPVDAKYVIGDKFPESWLPWASRRVAGSTPGFDFSGVVIQAPAGSGFATGDEAGVFFTNRQMYDFLSPFSEDLPYVYDNFAWEHCDKEGYTFGAQEAITKPTTTATAAATTTTTAQQKAEGRRSRTQQE